MTPALLKPMLDELVKPGEDLDHPQVPVLRCVFDLPPGDEPLKKAQVARLLRQLWDARYKPRTLTARAVAAWRQYITVVAHYFYPARHKLPPPTTLTATGDMLCDEEFLALVIEDGDVQAAQRTLLANREFWRQFIPPPEAMPTAQTVHARLEAATGRLADLLNAGYLAKQPNPRPATLPEPGPELPPEISPQAGLAEEPGERLAWTEITSTPAPATVRPAGAPPEPEPLPAAQSNFGTESPFLAELTTVSSGSQLDQVQTQLTAHFAFVEETTPERRGQRELARLLAQRLAAFQCGIAPKADGPTVLTRPAVIRILDSLHLDRTDGEPRWALVDFLERASILRRRPDRWELWSASLAELLAAEYLADFEPGWLSLRCADRGVMTWLAAMAAERGQAQRLKLFLDSLWLQLSCSSTLSVLEFAGCLAKCQRSSAPLVAEYRQRARAELDKLGQAGLGRLQRAVDEARLALRLEETSQAPGEVRLARVDLEGGASEMDLPALLRVLEADPPDAPAPKLLENRRVIRSLVDGLGDGADASIQLASARWLYHSSLTPVVEWDVPWRAVWRMRPVSAAEAVAQLALDTGRSHWVRSLAFSVLLRDSVLMVLWEAAPQYVPLVYEALLLLDKRLFCTHPGQWYLA